jgi:hypothetical protein
MHPVRDVMHFVLSRFLLLLINKDIMLSVTIVCVANRFSLMKNDLILYSEQLFLDKGGMT